MSDGGGRFDRAAAAAAHLEGGRARLGAFADDLEADGVEDLLLVDARTNDGQRRTDRLFLVEVVNDGR